MFTLPLHYIKSHICSFRLIFCVNLLLHTVYLNRFSLVWMCIRVETYRKLSYFILYIQTTFLLYGRVYNWFNYSSEWIFYYILLIQKLVSVMDSPVYDWYILVGESLTAFGTFRCPFFCVEAHMVDPTFLFVDVLLHIVQPNVFPVCTMYPHHPKWLVRPLS